VIVVGLSTTEEGATAMPPPIDHCGIRSGGEHMMTRRELRIVGWPLPPGGDHG
jgi:hypothetical protein